MTAVANLLAGSRLTASELQGVAPLAAFKGSDQSVTSSTVLVNDSALFVATLANATYSFLCMLSYEGGTQGSADLSFKWLVPTGATLQWSSWFLGTGGAASVGNLGAAGFNPAAGSNGAGNRRSVTMMGTLAVSTNAGNLQLQWAQNTSNGTATIVHAGSVLTAWQIA